MKAVIYTRISQNDQNEDIPSTEQLQPLREYADKNGYKIVREFNSKARTMDTFNTMIKYLQANHDIKTIIATKLDGLVRNLKDMATIEDLIENSDCSFIFVKENTIISKHSKAQEKLMFCLRTTLTNNYSNGLSERIKLALTAKAKKGIYPAHPPLGYKNCFKKEHGKETTFLSIDKNRASIIQEVFRLFATGDYSIETMTQIAFDKGLRKRNGARISKVRLYKMLRNPIYYGKFVWAGKEYHGSHEPLISQDLFDTVQKVFKA